MMQTTLCFDFGNTRYKCGVFENDQFLQEIVLPNGDVDTIAKVIADTHAAYSVLSSVIHHDPAIEALLQAKTHFHKVTHLSRMAVSSFGKAETVGADRWAMLMAGRSAFPRNHVLIIGLGSCITFNFLDIFGHFLGGSISPGLHMRFKAMNDHTALLPLVQPEWNFPLVGYDTKTNLLSGVILGMSKEIDGMIDEYNLKYDHLQVMMTGGDMSFFTPHLKNDIVADAMLVYKGIYAIGKLNF